MKSDVITDAVYTAAKQVISESSNDYASILKGGEGGQSFFIGFIQTPDAISISGGDLHERLLISFEQEMREKNISFKRQDGTQNCTYYLGNGANKESRLFISTTLLEGNMANIVYCFY